jgi:hypothetical protein
MVVSRSVWFKPDLTILPRQPVLADQHVDVDDPGGVGIDEEQSEGRQCLARHAEPDQLECFRRDRDRGTVQRESSASRE